MRGRGGKAWLVIAFWLVLMMGAPLAASAGGYAWQNPEARLPIYLVGTQSSMEAQMLGDKPSQPTQPGASLLPEVSPSLKLKQGAASLKLPYNLEMNISVHYSGDASTREPQRFSESPLMMKYSMDYRLLPNLQVGLSSYLYRPVDDSLSLQRHLGDQMGFGPELKYNLGQWTFLLRSQMESGNKDQGKDLQNWFRVWYAF
jgi:hypothetical protein